MMAQRGFAGVFRVQNELVGVDVVPWTLILFTHNGRSHARAPNS